VPQALDEHCLRKKNPKEARAPCIHPFPELPQRPETIGAQKIKKNRPDIRRIPNQDLRRPKAKAIPREIFRANLPFKNPGEQPRREAPPLP
jgi:hypothetical protein